MMSEFELVIWQLVAAIPQGRVSTYGQLAKLAGFPNHARHVGTILKNLPSGSTLPWHRVVNAKGQLSFALDCEQYRQQKSLLEAEGVVFKGCTVSLIKYAYS
jgi:methylated-DNA-protein-cysteine methyltransferase-like protein